MKQLHFSGVMVAVAALAAAVALVQKEVQAAIAGKDKSASDSVRASGADKSDGADAKDAPPAWIVSSTGTVARAEAGDAEAMAEIAQGYIGLAMSSNTETTDEERMAMIQESTKWMYRRAKIVVKTSEMQTLAEKGDETAMMDMARSCLFLAAARTMEAKGEERKAMFQEAIGWLRRRAEKTAASGDADAIARVANEIITILSFPEFNLNEEEQASVGRVIEALIRRRAKIMADREGDVESVRKRAEAGDPAAQRALGFRYSQGVDVEKDEKKAFEWTRKAAEQGDAKAMLNLANDYAHGDGVAKDRAKAIIWYRKAAKAFQALAEKGEKLDLCPLCNVGQKLLEDGSPTAPEVGMMFLGIAAKCGDVEAMRLYGEQFAIGKVVKEDFDTALLLLRKASMRGDEAAATIIDRIHEIASSRLLQKLRDKADAGDKEAKARFNKCMELFRQSLTGERQIGLIESNALAGHAPSQAQLGLAYMLGKSVSQDMGMAVEWLRKAVEQGEYRAMFWLGTAYEHGHGVAKDDWMAVDLWRRSHELGWDPATEKLHSLSDEYHKEADKGNASAQFFMGVTQEYGYAGKPDAAKAVEWYRKAAEQGHTGAQTFLGFALLTGSGVAKAPEQAVAWFRKAAEKGNPEAQQNLGRCLFYGDGCKKNEQEAVSWYRKAAEQGEASAMFNLGACYMEGTGVKKDVIEAARWFRKAASQGHKRSVDALEKLQKDSAR